MVCYFDNLNLTPNAKFWFERWFWNHFWCLSSTLSWIPTSSGASVLAITAHLIDLV